MPVSPHPWHFVSRAVAGSGTGAAPVLDFYVDVPGQITWVHNIPGRLAEDPLGGEPVQVLRGPTTGLPHRRGTLTLGAYYSPLRDTDEQHIQQAWVLRGPFDLTTSEGETFGFMFNAVDQGGLQRQWTGGHRIFQSAFYEVT